MLVPNALRGQAAAESDAREFRRILRAVYSQSATGGKEEFRHPAFFLLSARLALFVCLPANLVDPKAPPD
jgi:hypothetical protein